MPRVWEVSVRLPRRFYDASLIGTEPASVYAGADLLIGVACLCLAAMIVYLVRRPRQPPFAAVFWLLALFLLGNGAVCFLGAMGVARSFARWMAVAKLVTASAVWAAVVALVVVLPRVLALRGAGELEREVGDRRRAEELMSAFAAKLEQSNRELQEFASVASHDLQEPLRKIQAFGDRLEARCAAALDEQGRDYLARMQSAARRMRTLIDDLLTFSRVQTTGQAFLPVDLNAIAHEVKSDLEARIQQTGGEVRIGVLPTVHADPTQMRQLLQNLIGNGLKFHRPDAVPLVQVHAQLGRPPGGDAEVCQLTVEDNGIGFDDKYLGRLFQVFQRLHGRAEYEGTGMGLAICRRIVERHGGGITGHGIPGKGATFLVTLPVRPPEGGTHERSSKVHLDPDGR